MKPGPARGFAMAAVLLAALSGRGGAETGLPAPSAASDAALTEALAAGLATVRGAAREVGVHVVDLTSGREVFAYDADQARILASNTKLFTTAAALAELTPSYRYRTRFLARGEVDETGVLRGDIAVVGAGDPNLSGRFHDGDSFAPFRPWARALRARGVREIAGELVLINGLFEAPRVHPDWPRDQLSAWYEAPVDALSFNDNCVLVKVRPGAAPGAPPRIVLEPRVDHFRVENRARTSSRRGRLIVARQDGTDTIVVSGSIWQRSGPSEIWVAVHDSLAYFAAAVRAALAEEGVVLRGGHRHAQGPPEGDWQQVHVHESGLSETLAVTNKRSQNLYAESLAKLLGFRYAGRGNWQTAVDSVSRFAAGLGIEGPTLQLVDGSGLARGNRATPRAVTTLLERMYFHAYGRDFLLSLPYSGEMDNAWEKRLSVPPYRGNVFAKTGTLRGVSTLSGYVKSVSGRIYAFSILMNRTRGAWASRDAQDLVVRALVDRG